MMKKYIAGIFAISVMFSCTKQVEDAYINPNADVRKPIEELMPNIIANFGASATAQGGGYGTQNDGLYFGRYVQFWATNTALNQFDLMSQATARTTAAASDIGGSHWAALYYGQGQNLNRVIEWGTEEQKWDYVGVAHAIRAWAWLSTTDVHGEIIVDQAYDRDRYVFAYNTQQRVYEKVVEHAKLAIENLDRSDGGVSEANLLKGTNWISLKGDRAKWKKFTYAVLARMYHRTTNKTSYSADSVVKYCDLSLSTNADNVYVLFANTKNDDANYYGPLRNNVGTLRQTKFIADLQSGLNPQFPGVVDIRANYLIRRNTNGTFKGIRPGKGVDGLVAGDQPLNFYGAAFASTAGGTDANARYIFRNNSPYPVVTAAEIQFIKAEALYRKNQKSASLAAYTKGIELNIDMLAADYSTNIPIAEQITPAAKATFLANTVIVPLLADYNLSHIMLQKFIAMYGYGSLETWVDMRRYHYIDVEAGTTRQVYTGFEPPALNELYVDNNQKYIYRERPRFNSEYLYNIDALSQVGALGLDYHTKEQWFSQP